MYYNYYRMGMDKLYEDENQARAEVLNVLNLLNNFYTENPNKMINQFFSRENRRNWSNCFQRRSNRINSVQRNCCRNWMLPTPTNTKMNWNEAPLLMFAIACMIVSCSSNKWYSQRHFEKKKCSWFSGMCSGRCVYLPVHYQRLL